MVFDTRKNLDQNLDQTSNSNLKRLLIHDILFNKLKKLSALM